MKKQVLAAFSKCSEKTGMMEPTWRLLTQDLIAVLTNFYNSYNLRVLQYGPGLALNYHLYIPLEPYGISGLSQGHPKELVYKSSLLHDLVQNKEHA